MQVLQQAMHAQPRTLSRLQMQIRGVVGLRKRKQVIESHEHESS